MTKVLYLLKWYIQLQMVNLHSYALLMIMIKEILIIHWIDQYLYCRVTGMYK